MENKFELKHYLKLHVKVNRLVGLWPKKDYASEKFYAVYAFIMNMGFIHSNNVGTLLFAMSSTSLEEFIDTAYFISCVVGSVKAIFLFKYHEIFKNLLTSEIFRTNNVELSSHQYFILHKCMERWSKIKWTYACVGTLLFSAFTLGPMFDGQEYSLPMQVLYPFVIEKPIVYEITYFQLVVGAWANIAIVCCGDKLLCGFLAYIAAECEVLVDMLRNLDGKLVRNEQNMKMNSSLVQCIKYHREIIRFSKNAQLYFSKYLLILFSSTCLSTALMMTKISTMNIKGDYLFVINLQLMAWADLFIYCWYGSELTAQSEKIAYTVFESNWVNAPTQYKQDMLIFVQSVQTPIKIYAVDFFLLSVDTFTSILRTAWSYFTLLRQMSDEA